MIDGVREKRIFNDMDDVWEVVDLVINETQEVNMQEGKSFDTTESLVAQIPFFACNNRFFSSSINSDIENIYTAKSLMFLLMRGYLKNSLLCGLKKHSL